MTQTIFVVYDRKADKHLLVAAEDGGTIYDSNDGIPERLWSLGKTLLRRALVEGKLLDHRGARFEFDGAAVIVESVR